MTGTTDDGRGFALTPELENVLECSNEVSGTDQELATIDCVQDADAP